MLMFSVPCTRGFRPFFNYADQEGCDIQMIVTAHAVRLVRALSALCTNGRSCGSNGSLPREPSTTSPLPSNGLGSIAWSIPL